MIKTFFKVVVGFSLGFLTIFIFIVYKNQLIDTSELIIPHNTPTPTPHPTVIGWMSYWDEVNGFQRLTEMVNKLELFSPMLYYIGSEGQLESYNISTKTSALKLARGQNIPILPTIGDDSDSDAVNNLLTDENTYTQFKNDLITIAQQEGYIGWALDIEILDSEDEHNFTEFIKKLSTDLHNNNLLLHVIVYGRIENETYPPALAHNYEQLGNYADKVILMTYNYNNELTNPGPQTPISWLSESLSYATKVIPQEKIVVGLSTHGYMWEDDKVTGLTYPEVEKWLSSHSVKPDIMENDMTNHAIYKNQEVWFETGETIYKKIQYIQKNFGINEFALWRIGADDKHVWDYF